MKRDRRHALTERGNRHRDDGDNPTLDDRDERPGVKFKDADLAGFPLRVTLGDKSLARDEVELKPRAGALTPVKVRDVVDRVVAWLGEESRKFE